MVVEATLYHGDKPLCPTVTTGAHALGQTVRWKSTLNFKIKKKNIPKVYKISSPNCFIKSLHLGSIGLPKLTQLQHLQLEFTQMWYNGMWLVRPNLQSDWSPKFCIVLVCDPCAILCTAFSLACDLNLYMHLAVPRSHQPVSVSAIVLHGRTRSLVAEEQKVGLHLHS